MYLLRGFFPLFDTILYPHKVLLSSIMAKKSKFMKLEGLVWAGMQSVEIKLHSLYEYTCENVMVKTK